MLDDRSYMRPPAYGNKWSLTTWLILINIVVFVIQQIGDRFTGGAFSAFLALSVVGIKHLLLYQIISFQFIHSGFLHIIFNMLGLYMFGRPMEGYLGRREFAKLYFLSGSVGGLLEIGLGVLFPNHFGGAVAGASAGLFGLIAAFATRAPREQITMIFYFIPITMQARFMLLIEVVFTVVGIFSGPSNIAHGAHLGGIITGIVFVRWLSNPYASSSFSWDFSALTRPFRRRPKPVAAPPWKPGAAAKPEIPSEEFISQEVDPILDKISAHGIQSLTERERQILEAARKKMARR